MIKLEVVKVLVQLMFGEDLQNHKVYNKAGRRIISQHQTVDGTTGAVRTWSLEFIIKKGDVKWRQSGGRWRDYKDDTKLHYKLTNDVIHVWETYPDGSLLNSKTTTLMEA